MNRPINELCTGEDWIPGSIRFLRWLVQDITREGEGDGASKGEEREGG